MSVAAMPPQPLASVTGGCLRHRGTKKCQRQDASAKHILLHRAHELVCFGQSWGLCDCDRRFMQHVSVVSASRQRHRVLSPLQITQYHADHRLGCVLYVLDFATDLDL